MKIIPLTRGQVTLVDDEDFERVNQYKWYAYKAKHHHSWYSNRGETINGVRKTVILHRFIMNAPKGLQVDHRDGNGLNNQKSNLRLCVPRQQQMNMRQHNKYGCKGVTFDKKGKRIKRWRVKIMSNRKTIIIGYFATLVEAAMAYNRAAIKYFGEFAKLNPIP